jgi:PAS domain S-box-containing protein
LNIGSSPILIILFLICTILFSWFFITKLRAQLENDLQNNLSTKLHISQKLFNTWIDARINDVQYVVRDPGVVSAVKELLSVPRDKKSLAASPAQHKLLTIFKNDYLHNNFNYTHLIALDGTIISSNHEADITKLCKMVPAKYYSGNAHKDSFLFVLPIFKHVMPMLVNNHNQAASKKPLMFIVVPVIDKTEKVLAFWSIGLDPSMGFSETAYLNNTGKSGYSYAFNKDGFLITESRFRKQLCRTGRIKPDQGTILNISCRDPGGNTMTGFKPDGKQESWLLTLMARKALKKESGINVTGYRDYRGVSVVGAWTWDDNYNFGLAYKIDFDEVFKTFYSIRLIIIVMTSFLFFISLIFLVTILKKKKAVDDINNQLVREMRVRLLNEGKLQKSKVRHEMAQRIASIGHWEWNILVGQFDCSDEIYKIFGEKSHEFSVSYGSFRDRIHPDDRELVVNVVSSSLKDNSSYMVEYRIIHPDGKEVIVIERAEVILDETGQALQILGTIQNITKQKKIEKELQYHRNHLEDLIGKRTNDLQQEVSERQKTTEKLQSQMEEMELFSNMVVGREEKMIRLKEEINELRHRLGKEGKYRIVE